RPRLCNRLQNRVEPHDHSRSARCQRDENKKSALSCRAGPVPCEYSSSSPGTRNPSGTRYLRCGLCLFRRGGGSSPEKALSGAGVQPPSHQEQDIQVTLGTFSAAFAFSAEGAAHAPKKRSRGQVCTRPPTSRTSALPRRELHIQGVLRRNP